MSSISAARRRLLLAGAAVAAAPWAAKAAFATPAVNTDLAGTTLRVATYKGGWRALLQAAGLADTPYRIDWRELNNGVLHIEALNADALDIGSGSEIPAVFAARQKANVRLITRVREDLNGHACAQGHADPQHLGPEGQACRVRACDDVALLPVSPAQRGRPELRRYPADQPVADRWLVRLRSRRHRRMGDLRLQRAARAQSLRGARAEDGKGYLSGNFPVYANPRTLDDARRAATGDLLLRFRRAYAWANTHFGDYALVQNRETRVPVADLVAMFDQRSEDYALLPVTPDVVAQHQQVADVFARIGVLDGPANVAPLWDTSFNALVAAT